MKFRTLFLLLSLLTSGLLRAQETVEIKKRLNGTISERYFVIKGNRKVKHGPYERYNHRLYLEETGMYENGKRVGRWNFYKSKDSLEQRFNYTTNKVEFSSPGSMFEFRIKAELKEGDKVTYPALIGGVNGFGKLDRFMDYSESPKIFNRFVGGYRFVLFYVNKDGELDKLESLFVLDDHKEIYVHPITPEIKKVVKLVPARVNGVETESVIIARRFIANVVHQIIFR